MVSPVARSAVFSPKRLAPALHAMCAEVGLDSGGAELLRITVNAVFRLQAAPVVVRVSAPNARLEQVHHTVRVARWLSQIGFPAVRLHGDLAQPVAFGDYLATFWDYLPPRRVEHPPEALAALVRDLHRLTAPFPLPRLDPVEHARQCLAGADSVAEADRAFLERWCDELRAELALLTPALPVGVIHADAYHGNLLMSADGPVLCDLDNVCVGPREWDLVPTIVNALRFGHPPDRGRRFLDAYGFDVTAWSGFPALRKARELVMLAGVAPVLSSSPVIAAEFARRVDGLRNGRDEQWTPYAPLPVIAPPDVAGRPAYP